MWACLVAGRSGRSLPVRRTVGVIGPVRFEVASKALKALIPRRKDRRSPISSACLRRDRLGRGMGGEETDSPLVTPPHTQREGGGCGGEPRAVECER